MAKPFNPNVAGKPKKEPWERPKAFPLRGIFDDPEDIKALQMNKPYLTKLVAPTDAGALLGMNSASVLDLLREHDISPQMYRKRSPLYRVGDLVKLGKKIGRPFIIPLGLFEAPRIIYVGSDLLPVSRLWHPYSCKCYDSIFELLCTLGIPVQDIIFSAKATKKIEGDFLMQAGKLFIRYNNFVAKKEDKGSPKRIILCTKFGEREEAEKLVKYYNKKFPGVFMTLDEDHLRHLRELADQRHYKKEDIADV